MDDRYNFGRFVYIKYFPSCGYDSELLVYFVYYYRIYERIIKISFHIYLGI